MSDAAQTGIVIVVVACVLALGCIYWRLKIKPKLPARNGTRIPATGYLEVSRRTPNRVSITIYREPRQQNDDAPRKISDPVKQSKRDKKLNSPGDITLPPASTQPIGICPTEIHLVPPPPPAPIFCAVAIQSAITALPPAAPSFLWAPGPPPAPMHRNSVIPDMAAVPYPPDAPPPYFGHPAPPNPQSQYTGLAEQGIAPMPPPPQPPRRSLSPRRSDGADPETSHNRDQRRRRWFPVRRARDPSPGHARTVSDASSITTRSRTPSPTRGRGRGRVRRPSDGRQQSYSSSPHRAARQYTDPTSHSARRPNPRSRSMDNPSPRRSELSSSFSSSYLNSSVEAVYNNPAFHRHPRPRSPSPERRGRRGSSSSRERGPAPPGSIPLSSVLRQQQQQPQHRPPRRASGRREPSSDIQFPSPERRRPRVSFSVPQGGADDVNVSRPSLRSTGSRRTQDSRDAQRSSRDERGRQDIEARRYRTESDREHSGRSRRVSGVLQRVRRALRGEY